MDHQQAAVTYRSILKSELESRCHQNSSYSLRAFARDLELAPSRLSEIFNEKQGLSPKKASEIADKLGFKGDEYDHFYNLVASVHARSKQEREAASLRLSKFQQDDAIRELELDSFKVISDWYHIAILTMASLDWFQNDTRWIARKLGIGEIQADLAIERLIRLKLLTKQGGRLIPADNMGHIGGVPSESVRQCHMQLLDRAKSAIASQSHEQREFGSVILAIDTNQLVEAKEALQKFQHRFCKDYSQGKKKDSIYCLSVQFYSLERN